MSSAIELSAVHSDISVRRQFIREIGAVAVNARDIEGKRPVAAAAYNAQSNPQDVYESSAEWRRAVEDVRQAISDADLSSDRVTAVCSMMHDKITRTLTLGSTLLEKPANQHQGSRETVARLQERFAGFNIVVMTTKSVDVIAKGLRVNMHEKRLPLEAISIGGATVRRAYIDDREPEPIKYYLRWHELTHWIIHFGGKHGLEAFSTNGPLMEAEANFVGLVALWPAPAMAWLAMVAATRSSRSMVVPLGTHLDATNIEHVALLVRFIDSQVYGFDGHRERTEPEEKRLQDLARARIDAYNQHLMSSVVCRSPGATNWFATLQDTTPLCAAVRQALVADVSVMWGEAKVSDIGQWDLVSASKSFLDTFSVGIAGQPTTISQYFDDEVVLFKWEGIAVTSRWIFEKHRSMKVSTRQPFVYQVLYALNGYEVPSGESLLLHARLQTVPILGTDGCVVGSIAVIEPLGALLRREDGVLSRAPEAVRQQLEKRGVGFWELNRKPVRSGRMQG